MTRINPKFLQKEPHPVKARREQLRMTQAELAAVAKVSFPTVQRTEQGLMPSIPHDIYRALYGHDNGMKYIEFNFKVDAWKTSTRRVHKKYLDYLIEHPEEWYTWLEFREGVSTSKAGFCKLYCIHPHVLDHFEAPDKIGKRTKLASKIREAFYDAGVSEKDLDAIEAKLAWTIETEKMVEG